MLMAMDPRGGQVELPGEHVREPAFGLPATWIDEGLREEATFRGYTIVDPATVLTTHLTEILRTTCRTSVLRRGAEAAEGPAAAEQKKLVDDMIPSVVTATTLQRVLQALLRGAGVDPRLADHPRGHRRGRPAHRQRHPVVEHVRAAWPASLLGQRGDDGALAIITLSPDWEADLRRGPVGAGRRQATGPGARRACRSSSAPCARPSSGPPATATPRSCSPPAAVRPYVRSIVERFRGQTVVISQNEIHPKARLKTVGVISGDGRRNADTAEGASRGQADLDARPPPRSGGGGPRSGGGGVRRALRSNYAPSVTS